MYSHLGRRALLVLGIYKQMRGGLEKCFASQERKTSGLYGSVSDAVFTQRADQASGYSCEVSSRLKSQITARKGMLHRDTFNR